MEAAAAAAVLLVLLVLVLLLRLICVCAWVGRSVSRLPKARARSGYIHEIFWPFPLPGYTIFNKRGWGLQGGCSDGEALAFGGERARRGR